MKDAILFYQGSMTVCVAGQRSSLVDVAEPLTPFVVTTVEYAYDYTLERYRWALRAPKRVRGEDLKTRLQRMIQGGGGLGIILNGFKVKLEEDIGPTGGVWLEGLNGLTPGLSSTMDGMVLDVVQGFATQVEKWEKPPVFPPDKVQF